MSDLKYVFGPVPSRRLGRSLGIDIMPFKTCTYDCIYCQLGRTTNKTMLRDEYFNIDNVLRDTYEAIKNNSQIDYLTLSGSGEPTLNTGIGRLINVLKREFDYPVAVLTNGSLLFDPDVAQSLSEADVVMPTLASNNESVFQYVHRPVSQLHYAQVLKGIIGFSQVFKKHLWLEVFLIDGISTTDDALETIKKTIDVIKPEKIQLNTSVRPTVETYAYAVKKERLDFIANYFGSNSEVVTDYKCPDLNLTKESDDTESKIVELLKRRPCTDLDIASALSLHRIQTTKILAHLLDKGKLEKINKSGAVFYKIKNGNK